MEYFHSTRDVGTWHIESRDPVGEVIQIRSYRIPWNRHNAVDCFSERADTVEDERDHKMSQNAPDDAIWNRNGDDDQKLYDGEGYN